jgi:Protein of unknown function (DUF2877)
MSFAASTLSATVAGRFARDALALGEGEVCATFQRSCYLRLPNERYACIGDTSLGRGPLNALVAGFSPPAVGARLAVSASQVWTPPQLPVRFRSLERMQVPDEGFGCLLLGKRNALAAHAASGLEGLDDWLRHGLEVPREVEGLIGLGPGLTPSGDDYLGGAMVALLASGRPREAQALWRWLQPRLAGRTSAISAAHLAAAAEGEAHEALHRALQEPSAAAFAALSAVGHCSGWDALAGAGAVLRAD